MATLKSTYKSISATPTSGTGSEGTEIGRLSASAVSAKGKISEIIIANGSSSTDVTYSLTLTRNNKIVTITPNTTLAKNDVHVKSMSTFIQGGDIVRIKTSGVVKTSVSIIEL